MIGQRFGMLARIIRSGLGCGVVRGQKFFVGRDDRRRSV